MSDAAGKQTGPDGESPVNRAEDILRSVTHAVTGVVARAKEETEDLLAEARSVSYGAGPKRSKKD